MLNVWLSCNKINTLAIVQQNKRIGYRAKNKHLGQRSNKKTHWLLCNKIKTLASAQQNKHIGYRATK
jgi:hypothetical protein